MEGQHAHQRPRPLLAGGSPEEGWAEAEAHSRPAASKRGDHDTDWERGEGFMG